nr:hypothetical protein [uncultured Holophaga sp.]
MPISYHIHAEDRLLRVEAWGRDEGLEEVQRYGLAILEHAIRLGTPRILCDERQLEYDLDIAQTFESARSLAEAIAEQAPACGRVALVCSPRFFSEARFWSSVTQHRGLSIQAFTDPEEAMAWLDTEG